MMAIASYVFLVVVMLDVTIADETCWNDYQLGLDDGPTKGKEAARVTAKSFHCTVDMKEARSRLPKSGSCYEVGVRNGALWQLQALAAINQCPTDDFFNEHWNTESVPTTSLEDLKTRGLDAVPDVAKRFASQGLNSLKGSLASRFSRKSSSTNSVDDNQNERSSQLLEGPQQPVGTQSSIGRNQMSESEPRTRSNQMPTSDDVQIRSNEPHPMTFHTEPPPVPISSAQQQNIAVDPVSEQSNPVMSRVRSGISSFGADRILPTISPVISQQSGITRENTAGTREITQQQEQRLISTGTSSSDQAFTKQATPSNSLLIPTSGSRDSISSDGQLVPEQQEIDTTEPINASVQGPQQQFSIRTFKSESRTIV